MDNIGEIQELFFNAITTGAFFGMIIGLFLVLFGRR